MRVKKGVTAHARHRKVKKQTKGMQKARRSSFRLGKQAVIRSLEYAYRDRRQRKRDFRRLWIIRLNAASRDHGLTYSSLIRGLDQAQIKINRKTLSEIAINQPDAFNEIIKTVKVANKKPKAR